MKKLFFVLFMIACLPTFAQPDLTVYLCGNTANITVKEKANEALMTQKQILDCLELTPSEEKWTVASFQFSITSEGTVSELYANGNKIDDRMQRLIKQYNPDKIYLEKIKLISEDGTSKLVKPLILRTRKLKPYIEVSLCGDTKNTIKKEKYNIKEIDLETLYRCSELYSENPDFIIKSFTIGMIMTDKDSSYHEIKIDGNKLNERARNFINKNNPKKIYIDEINLVNSKRINSRGISLVIILNNE